MIKRRKEGEAEWQAIGKVRADVLTYSDTKLLPGTVYAYKVTAFNGAGFSRPSAASKVTTLADLNPPSEVTGLTARSPWSSTPKVNLDWIASTDPENGLAGYKVWRSSGTEAFVLIASPVKSVYVDTSVRNERRYRYYVEAFDTSGNISSPSRTVSVVVGDD